MMIRDENGKRFENPEVHALQQKKKSPETASFPYFDTGITPAEQTTLKSGKILTILMPG